MFNLNVCPEWHYIKKSAVLTKDTRKRIFEAMIDLAQNPEVLEACKTFRVKRLHVFGSFASGEIMAHSDVDLLVEFDREGYSGAFEQLMEFKAHMETLLQRPVDIIVNKPFRNPHFQEELDRTKQLVYAA
jgi:predicted nucleotidyltransferase